MILTGTLSLFLNWYPLLALDWDLCWRASGCIKFCSGWRCWWYTSWLLTWIINRIIAWMLSWIIACIKIWVITGTIVILWACKLFFHGAGSTCYISTWRSNQNDTGTTCWISTWRFNWHVYWIFTWKLIWNTGRIFDWSLTCSSGWLYYWHLINIFGCIITGTYNLIPTWNNSWKPTYISTWIYTSWSCAWFFFLDLWL